MASQTKKLLLGEVCKRPCLPLCWLPRLLEVPELCYQWTSTEKIEHLSQKFQKKSSYWFGLVSFVWTMIHSCITHRPQVNTALLYISSKSVILGMKLIALRLLVIIIGQREPGFGKNRLDL